MNEQQQILIQRLTEAGVSLKRFLKVGSNKLIPTPKHPEGEYLDKAAFEDDFPKHLYGPEDFDTFPRWGIMGSPPLVLLDFDKQQIYDIISKVLPDTFEVTSPRHGLPHRYYVVHGEQVPNNKFHIQGDVDEKGHKNPCGEIRSNNHYLVAPGTTIRYQDLKTGAWVTGEYKITNNVPLAQLEYADFMKAVKPYLLDKPYEKVLTDDKLEKGVSIGERHDTIFRYACRLVCDNPEGGFPASVALDILRRYNQTKLADPVEDEFCVRVIDEACEYAAKETGFAKEQIAEHGLATIRRKIPKEKEDDHMRETVSKLKQQFAFKTPDDTEQIYVYHEGVYEEAEAMIKGLVEEWHGTGETTHFVDEVLGHIRRGTYVKRAEFNKLQTIFPVQNGLLDLDTLELKPFDKDKIFTFKSNVTYDKTKTCPKFLKAVSEWVDPQDVPLLQEIAGYCLLNGMPFHHLFFLHGTGFNGKGSFIRTLEAVLGENNCANLGLEQFDGAHRFAMARLYGKKINVSSEPRTDRDLQTNVIKNISGEDRIDGELKNKQQTINFTNTAKTFILGNKFPKVNDNTTAFWERVIILRFPSNFIGDKQVPTIWNTWIKDKDEMSGILNWMIEGLHRLIKNNGFTKTKTSEEIKIEFQKLSDTTAAFINERCTRFKEGMYIKRDLYDLYKEYCDDEGLDCDSVTRFSAKLKSIPWIKSDRTIIEGRQEHVWKGLQVANLPPLPGLPPSHTPETFQKNKEEDREGIRKEKKKGMATLATLATLTAPSKLEYALGHVPPPKPADTPAPKPDTLPPQMPRNIPVKSDEYEAAAGLGLIPCPYCKAQGRKMFFASDIDLRAHISTFHEPQSYTR
jgi:putative DNA primase/helicase